MAVGSLDETLGCQEGYDSVICVPWLGSILH